MEKKKLGLAAIDALLSGEARPEDYGIVKSATGQAPKSRGVTLGKKECEEIKEKKAYPVAQRPDELIVIWKEVRCECCGKVTEQLVSVSGIYKILNPRSQAKEFRGREIAFSELRESEIKSLILAGKTTDQFLSEAVYCCGHCNA